MKAAKYANTTLAGREIEYRVIRSKAARKLLVRVGPNGVEVLQPRSTRPVSGLPCRACARKRKRQNSGSGQTGRKYCGI